MPRPSLPTWPVPHRSEPADLRLGIRSGPQAVVEICGEMDIQSAGKLRDELLRVVHLHGPEVTLDLAGVTFLDCAGVNVLLATRRRAGLEGGRVRITRASPRVRRMMALLGLQEMFALRASGAA
jgi:anti-anti-sigma factor